MKNKVVGLINAQVAEDTESDDSTDDADDQADDVVAP